jgi:hypothetical protein
MMNRQGPLARATPHGTVPCPLSRPPQPNSVKSRKSKREREREKSRGGATGYAGWATAYPVVLAQLRLNIRSF